MPKLRHARPPMRPPSAAPLVGRERRYPFFAAQWILTLFICAAFLASLYARVRVSCGPGPKTALQLGAVVGFIVMAILLPIFEMTSGIRVTR